jgi:hypothetical protein
MALGAVKLSYFDLPNFFSTTDSFLVMPTNCLYILFFGGQEVYT